MRKKSTLRRLLASTALLFCVAQTAAAQSARDFIYIVGSSTVYPFSTVAAERFGRATPFKTPKVESTGSGGGLKLFCDGVGIDYPDIANSSRAIKSSEIERCAANGVAGIVEVKIGYDGIIIANAIGGPALSLSRRELFLALTSNVPMSVGGELTPNTYRRWSDINPTLPATSIEVFGPPPTSGTRDVLVELVMESGCRTFEWISELQLTDPPRYREICHTIREDGAYIEVGENDNLIVQKLVANTAAFGIFGFSFLDQNVDKVKAAQIDGVLPDFASISSGQYPLPRPLYLYVKKAHADLIPGMRGFLREITSERAWGDEGYLADRGLIPLPVAERQQMASDVLNLIPLRFARE